MRESLIKWLDKIVGKRHGNTKLLADQILSLPVEGCDCTLGELPERARKMREALEKAKNLTAQITQSHIASIGSFGNTYVAQIDREVIDSLSKLLNDALNGD